ncbi:MAG: HNH endonuclease [Methylomonas sp.]|nr:HNH endonuclease [Methylomonas sp.]
MRPVTRGETPVDSNGKPVKFREHSDARPELINRMGRYCSYCEIHLPMGMAVEHIQPKELYRDLEKDWTNFLLSCPSCNSRKGIKDINTQNFNSYYWPHLDNTFLPFVYEKDRAPRIAQFLNIPQQQIATNTLKLTGLDSEPTNRSSVKDPRWKPRLEAWQIAEWARQDLDRDSSEAMRNRIKETATTIGFWSVWMTVFQDDADMRRRLIEAFPGTCSNCFDGQFQPISRPGGQI